MKKKFKIISIVSIVVGLIAFLSNLTSILDFFGLSFKSERKNESATSYFQSGGQTAHTINYINQQRRISQTYKVEKYRHDNKFILHIILHQSEGMWNEGTEFKLEVQTTSSYESVDIRGLPAIILDVRKEENPQEGYYFFSSRTAPLPGVPIVVEFKSLNEISVKSLKVEPSL